MKLLKVLLLCIILSFALFSNVYATETEEDLSDNLEILSSLLTANNNEIEATEEISTSTVPTSSQVVTTSTSSDDGGLSVSDIINIILIAVGLVLIFLAVAILLRSK